MAFAASWWLDGSEWINGTKWLGTAEKSLTDGGSGLDALTQVAIGLAMADTASTADGFQGEAAFSLEDSASAADQVATEILIEILDVGSGSDADTVTVLVTMPDGSTSIETLSITATAHVADSISVAELIAVTAGYFRTVLDSGMGSDVVSMAVQVTIDEAGNVLEATPIINANVTELDTVSAIENLVLWYIQYLTIADAAHGSDAISNTVTFSINDTTAAIDNVLQSILVAVQDAGAGSDVLSITVRLPLSDSANGIDALPAVYAMLKESDVAAGVENISVSVEGAIPIARIDITLNSRSIIGKVQKRTQQIGLDSRSIKIKLISH